MRALRYQMNMEEKDFLFTTWFFCKKRLASFDANTALSVGWSLGVVGELFEKKLWTEEKLDFFATEVLNGALVNRSVSEAQTGSPTRGGRPGTTAIKKGDTWVLNGRKIFTTASPVLSYFLTSAWIEEKEKVGFFLIHTRFQMGFLSKKLGMLYLCAERVVMI